MKFKATLCSALVACFWLASFSPANAQAVDQAQLIALQTRVTLLEARVPPAGTTELLLKQIAALQKDNSQLQANLNQTNARVLDLQTRVSTLESKVFAPQPAPGHTPTPTPTPPPAGQTLPAYVHRSSFRMRGTRVFRVDASGAGSTARAVVGNPGANRVEVGPVAGGSSSVQLFDGSGALLSSLVANPAGSFLRVKDSDQSAMLGNRAEDGRGLFLRTGTSEFITLTATKTGEGTGAGCSEPERPRSPAYFADTDGGRLVLTGAAGDKSVVTLSSTPERRRSSRLRG